jgi:hypothetical protein
VSTKLHIVLDEAPPKLSGYVRSVILPRRRFAPDAAVPPIHITRRGLAIDRQHLAEFGRLCHWRLSDQLPLVYPLMLLFHYHLGIFSHAAFPCSLRQLLGLRNHVVQRRRIGADERLDLDVRSRGCRVLAKGVEFDIHSIFSSDGEPVWESVHVYYLRGRYGGDDARAPSVDLGALGVVDFEARWDAPTDAKWEFAKFCGDLNPAHYFAPWARALGFRRDFAHTQRMVAECLRRLPQDLDAMASGALRLDVAFKGPVYYGSSLVLKSTRQRDGNRFDLYCGDVDKPAIPGRLRAVPADHDLLVADRR